MQVLSDGGSYSLRTGVGTDLTTERKKIGPRARGQPLGKSLECCSPSSLFADDGKHGERPGRDAEQGILLTYLNEILHVCWSPRLKRLLR